MPNRVRRLLSPARVIAPLALLASVTVVTVMVLNFASGQDESDGSEPPSATTGERPATTDAPAPSRPRRVAYRVRLNDTLGLIAERTGVDVATLQALNPELDPQNLIVGQRIKLRE